MSRGLQALADSHKAQMAKQSAKHLRAIASNYSIEYDWVREAYEEAERQEDKAKFYEHKISED